MSNDLVRPIADMGRRRQEMGRIRFGIKVKSAKGKDIPKAIEHFRFTSPDREAIEQVAALYGEEPVPWSEPRANPQDQFEVITKASVIRVFLPPDGISCSYELWAGSGCQRRCDGVVVELATGSAEDPYAEAPCVCKAAGHLECKPKTRLQVILPEVKFAGIWRLETSSWNAAEEMPAMERMAQQIQAYGMIEAALSLQKRSDLDGAGRKRHYIVPRIEFTKSPEALSAGAASVAGLGAGGGRLALKPGETPFPPSGPLPVTGPQGERAEMDGESQPTVPAETPTPDDGIIDAVIVEETPKGGLTAQHKALHALISDVARIQIMDPDTLRHEAVFTITNGKSRSSNDLTVEQMSQMLDTFGQVMAKEREVELIEGGGVRMPKVAAP